MNGGCNKDKWICKNDCEVQSSCQAEYKKQSLDTPMEKNMGTRGSSSKKQIETELIQKFPFSSTISMWERRPRHCWNIYGWKHRVSQLLDVESLSMLEDIKHFKNYQYHKKVRHLLLHSTLSGGSWTTSTKLVTSFFKMGILTSTICPFPKHDEQGRQMSWWPSPREGAKNTDEKMESELKLEQTARQSKPV